MRRLGDSLREMTRQCQMFFDMRTLTHRGMKSSKIYERRKSLLCFRKSGEGACRAGRGEQARTEKENPNHRQMGLLGSE